ncbi:MAG: hypothetical protein QOE68_4118 [Thermoanaerobaculia bacterium]|jgi:hypothetical protein|nr:hypothetical protein [Thermoanaerobaculia bacterium]
MKKLAAVLLALAALPLLAQAVALRIVNVNAPSVNYVFNHTGTVTVTDKTSPVLVDGFVQSRIYRSEATSPARGKYVYEYRIDLTNVVGILAPQWVSALNVDFGPATTLDFNRDGRAAEEVFIVTSGGLGSVGPSSATMSPSGTYFNFSSRIYSGASRGRGQSSYFFGLVSAYPPRVINAQVTTQRGVQTVSVYAPSHP